MKGANNYTCSRYCLYLSMVLLNVQGKLVWWSFEHIFLQRNVLRQRLSNLWHLWAIKEDTHALKGAITETLLAWISLLDWFCFQWTQRNGRERQKPLCCFIMSLRALASFLHSLTEQVNHLRIVFVRDFSTHWWVKTWPLSDEAVLMISLTVLIRSRLTGKVYRPEHIGLLSVSSGESLLKVIHGQTTGCWLSIWFVRQRRI